MDYIITLDVGTTSVKTCLFDNKFNMKGFSSEEYELYTPSNDIVELDPEIYWKAAKNGIRKVVKTSGADPADVRVITIVTQGETMIPVDKNGKALRNAIVWLDARAGKETEYISRKFSNDDVYQKTGLPELTGACPVSKVLWIKDNEPEVYGNTYKFLLLEDYLVMKLSGKFVSDKALISSTGYYDINEEVYWKEMLEYIDVEEGKFPEVLDCGVEVGGILMDIADELGINPAAIISTGSMDQAASAIGAGNIEEGIVSETTGTALVIAATTGKPDYSNPARLSIYKHAVKGKFLILPYCSTAGMVLKWFKDEFCQHENQLSQEAGKSIYAYLDELAASAPPLSNGLVILPQFAGMLTPEINPAVKGIFFGVGLDTKKAHFVRAILESIAFMLRENVELLEKMGVKVSEIRSLGGGSKSSLWCRIKTDVNHKVILTMEQEESTSLGAAILGSISIGMYSSLEDACRVAKVKNRYEPDEAASKEYDRGYRTYKGLYTHLKPMF